MATAYYLARNHGRTRVCVIEKGWLGGGNTGRNTTVVRSNYFYPESVALYDLALRLYEGLSRDLNFNVMLSQRGILNISHTPAQLEIAARVANAMQLNGVDAEFWGPRRDPQATAADDPVARIRGTCRTAASGSRAAARPATTPSRGATRAPPIGWASTSSRIAKRPVS